VLIETTKADPRDVADAVVRVQRLLETQRGGPGVRRDERHAERGSERHPMGEAEIGGP
jgi:hypothetical protein